jgi:hypothetical protein
MYQDRSYARPFYSWRIYEIGVDGTGLHRITTARGAALHPTPLPDDRILWSRWWVNFNQPSEKGIYNMMVNSDARGAG